MTTTTAATTTTSPQTTEDNNRRHNKRKLGQASSTGSLELNLLQDEEDGLMSQQSQTIGGNRGGDGDSDSDGIDKYESCVDTQLHLRDSDSNNNRSSEPLQQQNKPQQQQQQRDHVHYLSTLFAGVGSGALSSFICAPLDLIRTRMQVWGDIQQQAQQQQKTSKGNRTIPSVGSPAEAFRAILKKEGPKGMFRGLGATLVTVPLFWGVYFPLYDEMKDVLTNRQSFLDVSDYHPGVVHCLSAIMTGAVADVICNPFFVVRTRLQTEALHELADAPPVAASNIANNKGNTNTNNSSRSSSSSSSQQQQQRISMIQMARRLKEQHGMPVFWRGMTANLIGLSHCAVQFPAYEYLKGYLRDERSLQQAEESNTDDNTVTELLIASGLAKMTASLLSYPHEVLRSRMVDSRSSKSPTLIGTAQQIMRQEGIVGFYNGLGVTLIRVIPNCCVTFLSYELILKHSKEYFRE